MKLESFYIIQFSLPSFLFFIFFTAVVIANNDTASTPKKDIVIKCDPNETEKESDFPNEVLENSDSWFLVPNSKPIDRSIVPILEVSDIGKGDEPPPELPASSTLQLIGNHYEASYFCITPENHQSLILYGQKETLKDVIKICNDYECNFWEISHEVSPPPPDAIWITSSTALINCFTNTNLWHSFQHLLTISQLLNHPSTRLINNSIHFHPTFVDLRRNGTGYYLDNPDPFNDQNFPIWTLLAATLPKNVRMVQFNIFPNSNFDPTNVPKVCYAHGYIDGYHEYIMKVSLHPSIKFGSLRHDSILQFKKNALRLLKSENLSSGWCPGTGSTKEKPVLAFVIRGQRRIFCNVATMVKMAQQFGYEVQLLKFEKMAFEEQIRAMRLVDVFVGMHGAGLTHVFWARYGTSFIEIYPHGSEIISLGVDKYPGSLYGIWAVVSGSTHIATGSGLNETIENWRDHDVHMNLDEFAQMLKLAMDALHRRRSCFMATKL